MENPYVLFVETEDDVSKQLPPNLTQFQENWQSIRVIDANTAFDVLSQRTIGVVVTNFGSDQTGCEQFFREVHDRAPTTIRLTLLPNQDKNKIDGYSNGSHLSIAMDCRNSEITAAIERGLSVWRRAQNNTSLTNLLSKLHELPTPPALYFKLLDELESPNGSFRNVAEIVARDPALSARIIRVANSGFYASPRSIGDLYGAIMLLGTDMVMGLVLSVHLYDRLPLPGLNLDTLWTHSIAVSALAKHISSEEGGNRNEINAAGVAGLLHDLGSLAFLTNFPSQYQSIIHQAAGDEMILLNLENENFGVGHPELAGIVLDLWCLPNAVVEAVSQHHNDCLDTEQTDSLPSKALFLAEWLVNESAQIGTQSSETTNSEFPLNCATPKNIENWRKVCEGLVEQAIA